MRILFFAQLKDATGCAEVEWPDTGRLSAEQLWERLLREFPELVRAVTVADLRRVAEAHLHPDRVVIVSAGAG